MEARLSQQIELLRLSFQNLQPRREMFIMRSCGIVAALLTTTAYASPTLSSRWELPVIDLGYELHQAISYNEEAGYYNFSNVCTWL